MTLANQNWDSPNIRPSWHNRPGFTGGLFSEFVDHDVFRVVAEVAYTQKGMQEKQPVTTAAGPEPTGAVIIHSNRFDYLSFHLYGKLRIRGKNIVPYLLAGPRFDVLLGKQVSSAFAGAYERFRSTAFGMSLGLGTEVATMLPFAVLAEIRYNHDLSRSLVSETLAIKNRVFDIRLGVKF